MREINEIASGTKGRAHRSEETGQSGNYFFIRTTSKVGKIDRL